MTEREENQVIERLTKQFVLVPRDRFFHFLGGAVAIIVAAVGINVVSVKQLIKESSESTVKEEIVAIRDDVIKMKGEVVTTRDAVNKHLADLRADAYLRTDIQYEVRTDDQRFGLFISDSKPFNGANVVVAQGRAWKWVFVPTPKP